METELLRWINAHHCRALDRLMWGASASADFFLPWICVGVAVWALDRRGGKETLIALALSFVLATISVDLALKPLFARARPFLSVAGVRLMRGTPATRIFRDTWSFPSGHCASSAAAAWVLAARRRRLALPLAALVLLIAYSRVYLGMHSPSDCLAGLAAGVICGEAARRCARALFRGAGEGVAA